MKTLLAAAAALAATAVATQAFAAGPTATANATVSAQIVQPIAITSDAALSFGKVVADSTATTVIIAPNGAISGTGSRISSSPATAAHFNVTGEDGLAYTLTLPTSATLTASGGATMTVNGFTNSTLPAATTAAGIGFNVGGTLNIAANQASGIYSGTFPVSVAYQ
jgi:hypothetical protein